MSSSSISLNIQGSSAKFGVHIDLQSTVLDLKQSVLEKLDDRDATVDQLRLIFAGQILKNDKKLCDYNLKDGLTVHLVKSAAKPAAVATPQTEAPRTQAEGGAQTQPTSGQMPPLTAFAVPGAFPFVYPRPASTTGQAPLGPGGVPQMGGAQLRQALELMRSNPALYEQMMRMTPGFNDFPPEMQQMLLNPERLDHILAMMTDPVTGQLIPPEMMMGAGMPMPAGMMGSPPPSLAASQDPPEVRFQTQLLQLNDMGFWDVQANITALLRTGGNVHAAVEYLLAQPPPSSSQ